MKVQDDVIDVRGFEVQWNEKGLGLLFVEGEERVQAVDELLFQSWGLVQVELQVFEHFIF